MVGDVFPIARSSNEVCRFPVEKERVQLINDRIIGGGGETKGLSRPKMGDKGAERPQRRPKGGTPALDRMRLIDDDHRDGDVQQGGKHARVRQRFSICDESANVPEIGQVSVPSSIVLLGGRTGILLFKPRI